MAASDQRNIGETWLLDFPLQDSAGSSVAYSAWATITIEIKDGKGTTLSYSKADSELIQNTSTATTARLEIPDTDTATLVPGIITYCFTGTYTSSDAQIEDPVKHESNGTLLTAVKCP